MFCEKCGNQLKESDKFCTECGFTIDGRKDADTNAEVSEVSGHKEAKSERWWHRLGIVVYIFAHLPLLLIVPLVWSENASRYSYYSKTYVGSDAAAFWYSILTIAIWLLVLRLIKIALRYVVSGKKPQFSDILHF